jgi:hypothetical protein
MCATFFLLIGGTAKSSRNVADVWRSVAKKNFSRWLCSVEKMFEQLPRAKSRGTLTKSCGFPEQS